MKELSVVIKIKIILGLASMTCIYIVVFNENKRQMKFFISFLLFLFFQGYGYGLYWTVIDCLSTNTSAIYLSFLFFLYSFSYNIIIKEIELLEHCDPQHIVNIEIMSCFQFNYRSSNSQSFISSCRRWRC